jgi:hypothetical protein
MFDPKTYFAENEFDDVNGFVVMDHNEDSDRYHIAEKWQRENRDDTWLQYWIPAHTLKGRIDSDKCKPKGKIEDEQYEAVLDSLDMNVSPTRATV